MDKLSFISKTEPITVDRIEQIERLEVRDGVVTAYFEVLVNGVRTDTFNVDRQVPDLSDETQKALNGLASDAIGWLDEKRNPKVEELQAAHVEEVKVDAL